MNKNEIQDLGLRDLDVLVAEKVMNWHGLVLWADDDQGRDPYLYEPGVTPDVDSQGQETRNNDCIVPHYSDSDIIIQSVIKQMGKRYYWLHLSSSPAESDRYFAYFAKNAYQPNTMMSGNSFSEAVCRAAVVAVME